MSQSSSELQRYHKAIERVLVIVNLTMQYGVLRKRGGLKEAESLGQQICSLACHELPKDLEVADSLPEIDALVIQHGCGMSCVCGKHGASVHAAVVELAKYLALSAASWGQLAGRRDTLKELNRAKAALKYEIEKVKEKLAKPNQAEGNGGKGGGKKLGGRKKNPEVQARNKKIAADFQKGLDVNAVVEKYGISVDLARKIKSHSSKTEKRQS